jgi:hypothetical protein
VVYTLTCLITQRGHCENKKVLLLISLATLLALTVVVTAASLLAGTRHPLVIAGRRQPGGAY